MKTESATGLWALDLFCGAGGTAKGFQRAGFKVLGVDFKKQPRYCGEKFIQADALLFLANAIESGFVNEFAFIHTSPPCQGYSNSKNNGCHKDAPLLIPQTRELLIESQKPYLIENVEGAPLYDAPLFGTYCIRLCGASLGLGTNEFDLARHRLFESNIELSGLPCVHRRGQTIGVYGNGTNKYHRTKFGRCVRESEKREAMGIDWMSRKELTQAIPPAYAEFIAKQFRAIL